MITIENLIEENENMLEFLKRGSEPELKNYSYYKGKQDAYKDVQQMNKDNEYKEMFPIIKIDFKKLGDWTWKYMIES